MKNYFRDRYDMFLVVETFLLRNSTIVSSMAALQSAYEELVAANQNIRTIITAQEEEISGYYREKDRLKLDLVMRLYNLSCAAQAYAIDKQDLILLGKVKTTLTQVRRLTDEGILPWADGIMAVTEPHLASLRDYNWSETDMSNLGTAKDVYATFLSVPRDQKAIKANFTKKLKQTINDTTSLLRNKLDKLIDTYMTTNHDFYNEYQNCRKIITTGVRHTRLEGQVRDALTNEPIYNATVSLNEANKQALTDLNGNFIIATDRGIFTLTVTMPGYEPITITAFEIKRGESVRKNIALKRIAATGENTIKVA